MTARFTIDGILIKITRLDADSECEHLELIVRDLPSPNAKEDRLNEHRLIFTRLISEEDREEYHLDDLLDVAGTIHYLEKGILFDVDRITKCGKGRKDVPF